jgi:phasin family protein
MSSTDQNKPQGKPGERSRKPKQGSKRPPQRQRVSADSPADREQDAKELIDATTASTDIFDADASRGTSSIEAVVASTEPPSKGALVRMDASPTSAIAPIDTFLIGFQTIANAYSDYIRKSLDETRWFFERLTTVRSPDKALEIQTEFAKQACETFLSDSHKIWRLYSELARQIVRPFERLMTRVTQAAR